jgi:hypothetical protein
MRHRARTDLYRGRRVIAVPTVTYKVFKFMILCQNLQSLQEVSGGQESGESV